MHFPKLYEPPGEFPFTPLPAQPAAPEASGPYAVVASLEANLTALGRLLHTPLNKDVVIRHFETGARRAAIIYLDGMADRSFVSDFLIRPLLSDDALAGLSDKAFMETISAKTLSANAIRHGDDLNAASTAVLSGEVILLVDGCGQLIITDARSYEKRSVDKPVTETVIMGPQEGFTENLRTSITQLRRIMRSKQLITEFFDVGKVVPTKVALMYMMDIANPELVKEARRRIQAIDYDYVPGSGYLEQLLEDNVNSLVPQLCMTERPDRTASFLMEGHVAILSDSSPFSLCAPTTIWHLLHASDDSFARWPNGTFIRCIRMAGLFLSILLPSFYLAMIMYHSELLPTELLTSIAIANVQVPFPMVLEVLLMELAFDLVHEAGTRVPGALGSALGIIGALILGQAAVAAHIVSPILIIIMAVTGLGSFAIPDYTLSIGLRILRFFFLLSATVFGFLGIVCALYLSIAIAGRMTSFGVPWLMPVSPHSPGSPDIVIRRPILRHRMRPPFLKPRSSARAADHVRSWDSKEKKS